MYMLGCVCERGREIIVRVADKRGRSLCERGVRIFFLVWGGAERVPCNTISYVIPPCTGGHMLLCAWERVD